MPLIGTLIAVFVVTLWGANFVAVKTAITEVPALFVSALRFALLAVLLSPFLRLPAGEVVGIASYAMIMGVGHFSMLFLAMQHLDISTSGIVLQLGTPFLVLLAWALLGEAFGLWRAVGMAMAFGGVVVLAGFPAPGTDPVWLGVLAFVAAMWAWGSIRAKQLTAVPTFTLIAWMAVIAAPVALGLSVTFEDGQIAALEAATWRFWAALAYVVVGSSIVAYGLWYHLLQRYDVTAVAPYALLMPLVAVFLGVTLMGDRLTAVKIVGGALILGGVALITARQVILARRARAVAAPGPGA